MGAWQDQEKDDEMSDERGKRVRSSSGLDLKADFKVVTLSGAVFQGIRVCPQEMSTLLMELLQLQVVWGTGPVCLS
jgi:hypothetical protein